jgi:hypothetical protein
MAERQIRIRVNRDPDGHVLTANSGGHRVRPAQNYRASHNARRNYDRYLALAQAELQAGDKVAAENYYQHAEHYFRSMSSNQE